MQFSLKNVEYFFCLHIIIFQFLMGYNISILNGRNCIKGGTNARSDCKV